MADDSDDDLYGDGPATEQKETVKKEQAASSEDEPMDEESGDDSDESDNIEFIIDKPAAPTKPAAAQQPQESKAIKIEAPPPSTGTPSQTQSLSQPPKTAQTTGGTVPQLSSTSLSGTSFPAQRTSTLDVNANPIFPPLGKELLSIDIDANFAEEQKIWRRTGEDQSDYFNYGFDEFNWELYRQRQMNMAHTLQGQKNDMAQMQAMVGGMGMPAPQGMPGGGGPGGGGNGGGAAGGGGGPGGMPGGMNEQQMNMMMAEMMQQGMNPSQMDFNSFMQMAGQGMGGGVAGGFGGQQGGGFQQGHQSGGGRGGGRGGRGRGGW